MRDDIDAKPSPALARDGRHSATTMYATTMSTLGGMNAARPCEISRRGARENSWTRSSARAGPREGSPNARARGMGRRRVGSRRGGDDARRRATARAGGAGGTMGGRARGSGGARRSRARGRAAARARGGGRAAAARGAFEGFRSCD